MISIIIPVKEAWPWVLRCLQSIINFTKDRQYEVIVVDDCSKQYFNLMQEYSGIICIRNKENIGYGASCNRGINKARGDFIVILNSDVEFKVSDWLDRFIEASSYCDLIGVGFDKVKPNREQKLFELTGETHLIDKYTYLQGHILFGKRDLFKELDGFDEEFFMYCEDIDFCWRVVKSGKILGVVSKEGILHKGGGSGSLGMRSEWFRESSRKLYFKWEKDDQIILG